MHAVVLREFGPPERLVPVETADPAPGLGEVLVDVELANVTFVETQIRAGRPPHPAMVPALPVVLGNGVGGTVAAVGDGVDQGLVGRRVISSLRGSWGYAERAVAPADHLIDVPDGLSLTDAIALLSDGRTAVMVAGAAALRPGETALVLAAGGGVGSLLVQLAHAAGARVIAAAGSATKLDLARSLGAEVGIDYTREDWALEAGAVDVVFDGVGGTIGRAAFERVRTGGRFARFGMASGAFTQIADAELATRGVAITATPPPSPERLRELTREALQLASTGVLRPTIGQTFPLAQASAAHAAIEARATLGKTLLINSRA